VIEATNDPTFFGFYSPDLEGFTGIGHSIEDCLYQAKWGMEEHVELLKQQSLPIPKANPAPKSPYKTKSLSLRPARSFDNLIVLISTFREFSKRGSPLLSPIFGI
jgi:predicted RNase H-like HicB family nuclease